MKTRDCPNCLSGWCLGRFQKQPRVLSSHPDLSIFDHWQKKKWVTMVILQSATFTRGLHCWLYRVEWNQCFSVLWCSSWMRTLNTCRDTKASAVWLRPQVFLLLQAPSVDTDSCHPWFNGLCRTVNDRFDTCGNWSDNSRSQQMPNLL